MNEDEDADMAITELEQKHKQMKTDDAWLQLMLAEFRPHDQIAMKGYIDAAQASQQSINDLRSSFQQANETFLAGALTLTPSNLKALIDAETTLKMKGLVLPSDG